MRDFSEINRRVILLIIFFAILLFILIYFILFLIKSTTCGIEALKKHIRTPTDGLFKQFKWLNFTNTCRCKYHTALLKNLKTIKNTHKN